ncbi:MAG: hypothetical protein OEN50_17865, partial [Deltaproteobacteria bacterium]|nr:hypothetical protein [Deltaproteobacteria bacterium]
YLLRLRSWLSVIFLIVGFTLVSFGLLTDLKQENEFVSSLLPSFIFHYLDITLEERYELIGIAFLCLSAILCFRVPLRQFIAKNIKGCLLILLASGAITFGNGFLHYQYNPSGNLHLLALVMTIIGFLGLMFTNKRVSTSHAIFTLVTEDLFYTFIFLFFVLLPSIHGRARTLTAFLLWLPIMIFIAINLWRFHPAHQTVRSSHVSDSAIF